MKMLRYSGLAVLVVCIAAFASGCGGGGGGGGTAADDDMDMDVVMCTSPQVEMNGQCVDPPPTDAELIADAQDTLDGIVSDARTREGAARAAAAAVQVHPDATADQITSALNNAVEAQNQLTEIEDARDAADAATTPAQAESAVDDARAALSDLISAQSAVAAIQSAVNAVATARMQREADEAALTNNSSLIQHVRANGLLADALLEDLVSEDGGNDRLLVGPVGDGTTGDTNYGKAEYPADTGTGADRKVGQRTVMVQGLTSGSTTPSLSGIGHLTNGFDLKNADGSTFVNAFTDISKTRANVRTRTNHLENTASQGDPDSRYANRDFPDTDYLLAGIWLDVNNANLGNSAIYAFAHGSQPIINAPPTFCVGIEGPTVPVDSMTGTTVVTTTTRTCGATTGFDRISIFVKDGQDVSATYRGDANGIYIAGGDTSYFRGSVELNAEFQNPTSAADNQNEADGRGSIQGAVTSIVVGGQSMAGSIELQKHTFEDTITGVFGDDAVGVVDGKSFSGGWKGQFFGLRTTRSQTTVPVHTRDGNGNITATATTITTTYSPQHPGSVAGTFQVIQKSNPANEAAFIGAFGANR